jgi:hypothetical protein
MNIVKGIVVFLIFYFVVDISGVKAQHEHHAKPESGKAEKEKTQDHNRKKQGHAHSEKDSSTVPMSHAFSLNLPMNRNGSGTGWLPDSSTMYGHGAHSNRWMYMFHSNIFIRYNKQDISNKGSRGGEKIDAPNWFMFMGQRRVGSRGLFRFSSMFSLDPLTVGADGYPLLFQSGETNEGNRLVDRQHPHDLFSELSVAYTYQVSRDVDITAYFGYPGEPALGPIAFMHRLSALNNPDAPLGHHWQDATHITFGVATLGVRVGKFKIEGSSYTGREPDEHRYDFDQPKFDSYSYRLLFSPNEQFAFQASQAFIKSPEALEPGEDVTRTTASVIHHLRLKSTNRYLSTALVWGYNESDHQEHSVLFEPTLQLDKTAIYGRYESVQKSPEELELTQFDFVNVFNIQALTIGINRVFVRDFGFNLAVGVQGSLFMADNRLDGLYGKNPFSGEVYVRIYPDLMHMHPIGSKGD